ncbi:hypothetical protein PGT21_008239 [Puccinia graminis f. sp. tritici]|uniref:Uncharacterized protein n=1 Tax=Puccinia graminis f. sp. tritici TaxID=56615 RepID=A0A5B0P1T4_PUCGR|nr:hypothetical protein PGT21_008239 [Puccinia graminis f. sp. tritici]
MLNTKILIITAYLLQLLTLSDDCYLKMTTVVGPSSPPYTLPDPQSTVFPNPAAHAPGNPTVFTQAGNQRRPSVIMQKIQPRVVSNPKAFQNCQSENALVRMRAAFAKNAQEAAPVDQQIEPPTPVNTQSVEQIRAHLAQSHQTDGASDATGASRGPELSPHLVQLIEKIPTELSFLLEPNLNLEKKSCTKELILKGIKHFMPGYKPPVKQPKKGLLVRAFQLQILPLIAPFVQWKMEQFEQAAADESLVMQEDPAPVDLSGINPNNPNITTDIILTIIAERRPSAKLPESMSKAAAINFFYQYISPRPPHGHPQAFTTWPKTVPMPYHRFLTRDELRYIIQCYVAILFIPCAVGKVHLLAIYEQFVLDEISEETIFEGIHYFVRQDPNPPHQS